MSRFLTRFSKLYDSHLQLLLVVCILFFGFITATSFSIFKDEPEQLQRPEYSPLVQVIQPVNTDLDVRIQALGSIQAQTRINMVPQVGGRVISIQPSMRAGGYFQAGDELLEIEPLDYELAVVQAESEVASARTRLETEQAEANSAKQEWLALQPDQPIPTLVGREPQIAEAEASVKAAQARLKSARLDLQRTRISMPFDGRIVEMTTDLGDVIAPNQSIGIAYSSEVLEVPVPIEADELAWISMPNNGSGSEPSRAIVHIAAGENTLELGGKVSRVGSELNAVSRLAQVIIELDLAGLDTDQLARVIPGQFVDVEIIGKSLSAVMAVPRTALHDNQWLWTVDNGQIRFVSPKIVRETAETIFISGLQDGTPIVVSNLDVVTDGMSVRTLVSDTDSEI